MSLLNSSSPLLKPARFLWSYVRKYPFLQELGEKYLLYPTLPHIQRQENYEDGPWLVAGFFSSPHGIGEGARLDVEHLRASGQEVYAVDISQAFGLAEMPVDQLYNLCTKESAPRTGPLLISCNGPELGRALQYLGAELTSNRRIIARWAWELESLPTNWDKAYAYVDEIWAPSTHCAKAFAKAPVPVKVCPYPRGVVEDGGHSGHELGLPDSCNEKFLFLCMADCRSDLKRKNILGAVKAFLQAFPIAHESPAILVVKLHHTKFGRQELVKIRSLAAGHEHILLIERLFSQTERNSLLHRCHCLVSLHRAEGYGLPLAEAISISKPVIATAYSANMDFMNAERDILIPYTLVDIDADTPNYQAYAGRAKWAEPDIDVAAKAMARLVGETQQSPASETGAGFK